MIIKVNVYYVKNNFIEKYNIMNSKNNNKTKKKNNNII